MKAEDVIKKIDPDYVECEWCHRMVPIDDIRTIYPAGEAQLVCNPWTPEHMEDCLTARLKYQIKNDQDITFSKAFKHRLALTYIKYKILQFFLLVVVYASQRIDKRVRS